MRQVLCPVLVGREEEARLLLDAVGRALDGHGGTSWRESPGWEGKSRLVREVSQAAASRGLAILTGRAVPGGTPVPYRPLAEAVLGGLRHEDLDQPELCPFRPALRLLLPESPEREPTPVADSPVVIGEGLLRLLRATSGECGCVLVLEDLHWADPESLAVLEYVVDNLPAERIV